MEPQSSTSSLPSNEWTLSEVMTSPSPHTHRDDVTPKESSLADDNRQPLISDEQMFYVSVYISISLPILVSCFGIVTNLVNLTVFSKLGLKDGMGVGLWALSFSDLLVTLQTLGSSLCFMVDIVYPDVRLNPILLQYVSFCWGQDMMYLVSNWTTTFLSLERCVCVIAPFKVKTLFTKRRSILVIVFIYLVHLASYVPIFATHQLGWKFVAENVTLEKENTTILFTQMKEVQFVKYAHNRALIHHAVDIINGTFLPVLQQAIVIASALCLVYGLKSSSKIRLTSGNDQPSDKGKADVGDGGEGKEASVKKPSSALSQKESKLLTVVVLLALILTVCNIPRLVAVYATLLVPDMYIGRLYENLYVFMWALTALFASLNASVNICVYWAVNRSYRRVCLRTFCSWSGRAGTGLDRAVPAKSNGSTDN